MHTPATFLLSGGSGDLGSALTEQLTAQSHRVYCLDPRQPQHPRAIPLVGSILQPETWQSALQDVDVVVHIAAWHGIHALPNSPAGTRTPNEFWELNVTGTFRLFSACQQAGIRRIVNISSTSILDGDFYGFTKQMGEEIANYFVQTSPMQILSLRPRAFIPHQNRVVYANFAEWARWYWGGAVHLSDVTQATQLACQYLLTHEKNRHAVLTVDGAYEYTWEDLAHWDTAGRGSTFRKYYAKYETLAERHNLDIATPPHRLPMQNTETLLGYRPQYSHGVLLQELAEYDKGQTKPIPTFIKTI